MWITAGERLNTVAVPMSILIEKVPAISLFVPDIDFTDFDPWREGGIADHVRGLLAGDIDEESERFYVEQPVPFAILSHVQWGEIATAEQAESAIRSLPARWQLDVAQVFEDLSVEGA